MIQGWLIRRQILIAINNGITNKSEIYTNVCGILKVPRATVRRVTRDIIIDMEYKLKILRGTNNTNVENKT